MTEPYPQIERWLVPRRAMRATLRGVRPAGRRGCESGAFWLGHRAAAATVTAVVLPGGAGVEERPDQWRVSAEVYGRITEWARERSLSLLAVAHTHGGASVALSDADRKQSVQVPGVMAVVIDYGGDGRGWHDWSWNVYEEGDYRRVRGRELRRRVRVRRFRHCTICRADSAGVTGLG